MPLARAAGGGLLLGELTDGLQHRIADPSRPPIGNEQRPAHQGIEAIQDHVVVRVIETGYSAGALEVKSAREHRTPFQQRRLGVIASRIASASASHRRVEPSTSVKRNVTTPEGAPAAHTPAEWHTKHHRT
jgi:hypothetical protein